ncbi:palmitoyltransferase, putative, partial [Hepatocystis sp. ex Piliocolobus tephrosceles]
MNILSFFFITVLSFFIYICYLYSLNNDHLNNYSQWVSILLGILSGPLFIFYYWSYIRCSLQNPGYVTDIWRANAEENNIRIECRKIRNYAPNVYTVCDKCDFMVRPERAHHCSICNKCILKMDHHCPWLGTCVGEKNMKFFFLFLFYGFLITLYITLSITPTFIQSFKRNEADL